MGFIQKLIRQYKEKNKLKNDLCNTYIDQIDKCILEIDSLLNDMQSFIEPSMELAWKNHNKDLINNVSQKNLYKVKGTQNYNILLAKQNKLNNYCSTLSQLIFNHNDRVSISKIQYAQNLIGNVENCQLDSQQMKCIVKDFHNHLVIAGAGTGKTTTIIGKLKYLLKSKKCNAEDILVLSFTNASATEMKKRIQYETGEKIDISTFHKLGINIITDVAGVVPKISKLNLENFIEEQLISNMNSNEYLKLLNNYLLYSHIEEISEFDFKTYNEYNEHIRENRPITLNRESVKSYGEMDIANFLTQNGIRYIYEHPYEIDTRTNEYNQYCPDFYLPDYNIYIEYFSIDKKGQVPSYFKAREGMTPTQTYQASMKWKREIHKMNHTTMIECYAYEKFDNTLLENLKQNLIKHSVPMNPISQKDLYNNIIRNDKRILHSIVELFETLINLIKSNKTTIASIRQINKGNHNERKNEEILQLFDPIYAAYCKYLIDHEEIDFNDMINTATDYVVQRKYTNHYKYVIIDEYQDISKARFSLLYELRKSNYFDLFCVGDDWQSIYRFAGSDINLILNFEKYWGLTVISRIETTYRFTPLLAEISGEFVMNNPAQIKKHIMSKLNDTDFPLMEISGYTEKNAVEFMVQQLNVLPQNSSVFFIGRYRSDLDKIKCDLFDFQYINATGLISIKYATRPDLRIEFVTAHKSKGLQADYVFIINNRNDKMGFPSKIQNHPILELLLDNYEEFPHAEERRLYYVALTRAKRKVFLITTNCCESIFISELRKKYLNQPKQNQLQCPRCGGRLVQRSGPYGNFWGCTNYRSLGCTYKRKQ